MTRTTPVIAVTLSGVQSKEAEAQVTSRMLEMGFAAYIPKPINPLTFAKQVERLLPLTLRG
jgi:CheY-like chemotaxis protein